MARVGTMCISLTVSIYNKTHNCRLWLNGLPTWAPIWALPNGPKRQHIIIYLLIRCISLDPRKLEHGGSPRIFSSGSIKKLEYIDITKKKKKI